MVLGGPTSLTFDDLVRHPTYSELWGFIVQYLILEQVTKNPHQDNGVLGNQCSFPDYSFHDIAFAKVCGLGEPAITSFSIFVLFYNLMLKLDIHKTFPQFLT